MTLREQLIDAVNTFCKSTDITPSTLSNRILNDGKRIPAILAPDGDCSTRVWEKIMREIGALPKPQQRRSKRRPMASNSGR